ncbi:glycosyltransferase [Telmatospirillum sp.]|uniref:glycosyltransferase n=1 Tax=Telmatospirillum sp. TaxID=2079197 RepID=UPI00284D5E9D|nr:glycosyltransferase [Telmatospirillum sp.]MDR3435683.1 glycosyltransferase [Telmatospirillum sp.]
MPRLDIVIVNWNAGNLLHSCIRSVLASDLADVTLARLVVVDNNSTDGSMDALGTAPVTAIRLPANVGFAAGCNIGARGSDADYLLFLNPDVRLDRDSLAGAVAFMEAPEHRDVAVSGIRLRDPAGITQRCCARFPTPGRILGWSIGLDRLLPTIVLPHFLDNWDHQDTRDVPQVMGAFLLIRRTVFERLGGFDERFFVYYEDVDLCLRATQDGGRCVHNASVSAVHVGGGTTDRIKAERQFYTARSRIQYVRKHFGTVATLFPLVAGLLAEPLARLCRGALRARTTEMTDAVKAAGLLWRDLPQILGRQPEKSGSLRTEAGDRPLSVLALTRYPRLGASSRTRFLAYLPALRANGMTVTITPFFDNDYLPALYSGRRPKLSVVAGYYWRRIRALAAARRYDLVWIEKEALPWVPLSIEMLLLGHKPFAVDFDDAWFHRYESHRHFLVRGLLGTKFEGLVRRARMTLVGNDFLVAWARSAGARNIRQLPTAVDLTRYQVTDWNRSAPLRIGWIGTPTSAAIYLRPLLPTLADMIHEGWATLTVVGADDPELHAIGATVVTWKEAQEIDQLHSFDVGIMPLSDDLWSLGKCAYKLIQYMAVGLPVVASPVGMNRKVVVDGVNGFLATTPEEWRNAFERLAADPEMRRRMGEAGRKMVAENYALSVLTPVLIDALRSAADRT